MRLDQSVPVPASVTDVWTLLEDIPTVAACMPGAQLTRTVDDTTYEGTVRVAIGPLAMNYTGVVTIEERDEANHTIVLTASGRDRRGSGTAKANVTARVLAADDGTRLEVGSDLQLTGRIAALGRGVNDVANRLFTQFAEELAGRLDPDRRPVGAASSPEPAPAVSATRQGAPAAPPPAAVDGATPTPTVDTSIRLLPLVVSVTRERLAALLLRLSERVRP